MSFERVKHAMALVALLGAMVLAPVGVDMAVAKKGDGPKQERSDDRCPPNC
jgi:hypothetical protein